jgi:hypothetical protein
MTRILTSVVFALALTGISEPKINGVQPEKVTASAKPQQVTVSGQDFREGLTLVVTTPGGQPKNVSGADIVGRGPTVFRVSLVFDAPGPYELVVLNSDGGKSPPFRIDVKTGSVPPSIDRIQPAEISRSQEAQLLTLRGAGFEPGLRLSVTDPTGSVVVKDAFDRLEPTIAVVRLVFEVSGTYALMVTNPSGGQSNSISLTIR